MLKKFIPGKKDRFYYSEDLSYWWFKAQSMLGIVKEFSSADKLPEVESIFFNKTVQTRLDKTYRWQDFAKTNYLRPQSFLEHSASFVYLADHLISKMNGNLAGKINKEMVMKACVLHDVSKGVGGQGIFRVNKNSEEDVVEFLSFSSLIASKDDLRNSHILEKIYLLQFCLGDVSAFPSAQQKIMRRLAYRYKPEALMFQVITFLDYLFYAEEQYVRFGKDSHGLIHEVTTAVVPLIEQLVPQIPGLDTLWTPKAKEHFSQFI